MLGQFRRKNSASALERIWLQCCLPSHLNCWLETTEEEENPALSDGALIFSFEMTGEDENAELIEGGKLMPPLKYAENKIISNPNTCVLNGPLASCQ